MKYIESPTYQAFPVDGAVVTNVTDQLGTTVQVMLSRIDHIVRDEEVAVVQAEKGPAISGTGKFDIEQRKVLECSLILRPDNAFAVASAIFANLSKLSDDQRERYNLPKIEQNLRLNQEKQAPKKGVRKGNGRARTTKKSAG